MRKGPSGAASASEEVTAAAAPVLSDRRCNLNLLFFVAFGKMERERSG